MPSPWIKPARSKSRNDEGDIALGCVCRRFGFLFSFSRNTHFHAVPRFSDSYTYHAGRTFYLLGENAKALSFLRASVAAKENWNDSRLYLSAALANSAETTLQQEGLLLSSQAKNVLLHRLYQVSTPTYGWDFDCG
jgi:hypothetical protein